MTEADILRRGLPASPRAERAILGACLLAGMLMPEVAEAVTPSDFLIDSHRTIYAAMQELASEGVSVEDLTVVERLERRGELQAAGGIAGVADLTEGFPRYENVESYVSLLLEKSRLRRLISISQTMGSQALEQSDTPEDIAGRAVAELLELDAPRSSDMATFREAMGDAEFRQRILNPHARTVGVSTGFPDVDSICGGLCPGELVILAARPSMGKTTLALGMASHVATSAPVIIFSLESTREALFDRLVSAHARVDIYRRRNGLLNDDERRRVSAAVAELSRLPLHIAAGAGATVQRVAATARRLKSRGGLGLVVVDYLHLLRGVGRAENRTQEVSAISRDLSIAAKELGVPILALSQLSRAPELRPNPQPKVSDLRESGTLEQDADKIMLLFRPEVYKRERDDLRGIAELEIAKNRDGATGTARLAFIAKWTRFDSMAHQVDDEGGLYE